MTNSIKKQIEKTGYLTNRKIGGVIANKYPELYNEIIKSTFELNNGPIINQTLRARTIFIMKYDNLLTNIIKDTHLMVFNRTLDDFRLVSTEYVKNGWKKIKNALENVDIVYDKTETIKQLKNDDYYLSLFGRAKNRTLIKNNPKLYKSIYYHTRELNSYDKNSSNLYVRILYLIKYEGDCTKIVCKTCGQKTSFNRKINGFVEYCINCFPKYPSQAFFKNKYGSDWEIEYDKAQLYRKSLKTNSKSWFIKKYGETNGITKYLNFVEKKIDVLNTLTTKRYSKISQDLFWLIYNKLTTEQQTKCQFKTLNYEQIIKDPSIGCFYFPDFVFNGKKIIEYDCSYWHNNDKDKIRNDFYGKMGYDVLVVTEDDFNRNNKSAHIINKCLQFILDEN